VLFEVLIWNSRSGMEVHTFSALHETLQTVGELPSSVFPPAAAPVV